MRRQASQALVYLEKMPEMVEKGMAQVVLTVQTLPYGLGKLYRVIKGRAQDHLGLLSAFC